MKYDLIVVGAGPAGLLAAKTAAEHNLEVMLVDAKKEIPQIIRPCGMMLHLAPGLHNIRLTVDSGKLVFHTNNFSINYTGDLYDLYYWYFFSRSGYKFCLVNKNPCLGKVIDKGELLRSMLEEAEELGVTVHTETTAVNAQNTRDGVTVHMKSRGRSTSLDAKTAVVADGVNSPLTASLGLNERREFLGRAGPFMGYVLEGVECPYEHAILFYRASTYAPTMLVNTIPRACGNDVWLVLPRTEEGLQYFLTKGKVAGWFQHAKIVKKGAYHSDMYTPLRDPVVGNILVTGDAAGSYEVEIHGALACGYHAGRAIAQAVQGDIATGLKEYVKWWQTSIEYVRDPSLIELLKKAAVGSFEKYFTEEEVDYLFRLVDHEMFPGLMDPFKLNDATVDAFLKHHNILQKQRPALLKKIEEWIGMSAAEFNASRSAFSYPLI